MRYLSVCSGIEAATAAWQPLGWQAVAFSEIEPFPSAVLAYHYPDVPNLGDMTKIDGTTFRGKVDILVGGTPCQGFSVAGLRGGLSDDRSNLCLAFVRLADEIRPDFVVWENVPGVLSMHDNSFGEFLAGLAGEDVPLVPPRGKWANAGCVFGPKRAIAWRILDAQFFGVAQRRRRVFLIASPVGGADPAKVLFERESLQRDTTPCRKAGKENPRCVKDRAFTPSGYGQYVDGVGTLKASGGDLGGGSETLIAVAEVYPICLQQAHRFDSDGGGLGEEGDPSFILRSSTVPPCVATPIAFKIRQGKPGGEKGFLGQADKSFTLSCNNDQSIYCAPIAPAIGASGPPYSRTGNERVEVEALAVSNQAVRRLMPVEAERLQGFPDHYTDIEFRGKPAPDGARYKALGNSMCVNVMRWIGERIQKVEDGEL